MSRPLSVSELANMAAEVDDQTETQEAGVFEREVPAAGVHVARFIEYIETGKHKQKPYQGKEKPDAEVVRVTFELLHPKKSIIEYEHEGEKRVRGQLITIRVKKSLSDKASFKKLFNAMTYGRDGIKHMAQMLGEPFLVHVTHNTVKGTDGRDNVYANLNKDGVFQIGAPRHIDPMTEVVTKLPVREPIAPVRIFLWNNPTKETWDSLFIDGTREVKAPDGSVTQESKNWLQELILSATNFNGSALDSLLHGVSELPVAEDGTVGEEVVAGKADATTVAEKTKEAPAAAKATVAPENSANAALEALGLVG
jgi:hypothetical protein